MAKGTYGFSALMESIDASVRENRVLEEINDVVTESCSYLDIGANFLGEDEIDKPDEEDYTSPEDEEKYQMYIDMLEPTEDEDNLTDSELEKLEESLESVFNF